MPQIEEIVIGESVYNLSHNDDYKNILTYLQYSIQNWDNQLDLPLREGMPLETEFNYSIILAKRRAAIQALKLVLSELERAKQTFLKKREVEHERREGIHGGSRSSP
jgi:hypothetical protein